MTLFKRSRQVGNGKWEENLVERRAYKVVPAGQDSGGRQLYGIGVVSNIQGFYFDTDEFSDLCAPTTYEEALRRARELDNEFKNS